MRTLLADGGEPHSIIAVPPFELLELVWATQTTQRRSFHCLRSLDQHPRRKPMFVMGWDVCLEKRLGARDWAERQQAGTTPKAGRGEGGWGAVTAFDP